MIKSLVFWGILLFPFQNIGINFYGSRYDISAFLFLGVIIFNRYSDLHKGILNKKHLILLLIFFTIQINLVTWLAVAPIHRFISSMIWLGGLVLLSFSRKNQTFNQFWAAQLIILLTVISGIFTLIQYFHLGYLRPQAWFNEPSPAGLVFYSASLGLTAILLGYRIKIIHRLLLFLLVFFFLYVSYLTKSFHFITFGVIFLFLVVLFVLKGIKKAKLLDAINKLIICFIFILSILSVVFSLFQSSYFLERLNLSQTSKNVNILSILAWLQGFDQMLASVVRSPLFGLGLGSTGYFDFFSDHSLVLTKFGVEGLTITDAYSLGFRLIIEVGLIFFALFAFYLLTKTLRFAKYYLRSNQLDAQSFGSVFNTVFSLSVCLGCLIKEPLYPQSFLYLSIFMLGSVNFKKFAHREGKNSNP